MLIKPQRKKLDRWDFADNCIRLYKTQKRVIPMIIKKFSVSKRTAIDDFHKAMQVFNSGYRLDKEYMVAQAFEEIAETRELARVKGNPNAMAKCDTNKINAIEKLLGDKDTPDYSQVQLPEIVVGFFPEILENEQLDEKELNKQLQILARTDKEAGQLPNINLELIEDATVEETLNFLELEGKEEDEG